MSDIFLSTQDFPYPEKRRRPKLLYIFLILAANIGLFGVAIAYALNVKPNYTSTWALTLPSAGMTTDINLPNIGDASARVQSPYNNATTRDPRDNYKFLLTSRPVISRAATELGLEPSEFGRPTVSTIDNTTIMTLEVEGATPEEAQQKSYALYNAFQETLRELRAEEMARQNEGVQEALSNAEAKLIEAQRRLAAYKAGTELTSTSQIDRLSANIEDLRQQRALLVAQFEESNARLSQLSNNLEISPREAAEAFTLNSDPVFQQNLADYSDATAQINALSTQLGPNHPTLVREATRRAATEQAMLERAQALLGRSVNLGTLAQLNIGGAGAQAGRGALFQDTVLAQVDQRGLAAQIDALSEQIIVLENRLKNFVQEGVTLETLTRDVTIAEAIFSSTMARLDLSQADSTGSYPQVQMVTEPSLPQGNKPLKAQLALVGALFGSFFITTGLITLWIMDNKRSRKQPELAPSTYNLTELLNGTTTTNGALPQIRLQGVKEVERS